jgi:hypothetical protein
MRQHLFRRLASSLLGLDLREHRLYRSGDLLRDLVLDRKYVRQVAVIVFGPDMPSGKRIN